MNKTELIAAYASATEQTKVAARAQLEALQELVFAEMKAEKEVKLFDSVSLIGVHKDATTARNPMTGEQVQVPAKTTPKVKFGKVIKDYLNA